MPAPKGHARYGGRKKGTPNKLSVRTREMLWDYCQSKKVNPFEHAVDVLAGEVEGADVKDILDCAKDLRSYLLPKLKQVEAEVGPRAEKVIRFIYGRDK